MNGALKSTATSAPYSYSWNTTAVSNGTYTVSAKAYDAAGNVGQSSTVTVAVNNVVADTIAPTVALNAPANNATLSGTATLTATASDNVGVTRVEFYVNGVLQASDTAAPYSYTWNTAAVTNGTYTLSAKAYDAAGNVGQSPSLTVTVSNQATTAKAIAFVQVAASTPQAPTQTVSASFSGSQTAGDLNIVVIGWYQTNATVQSVTDSMGNLYTLAAGPVSSTDNRQSIYYAHGIKGGSNKVTVTFSTPVSYPDLRILEYAGVSTLDKSIGASGNSATASAGSVTTTTAKELIFSANDVTSGTKGAGTGFTSRIITSPDSDIAQDRIVSSVGTYAASAPLSVAAAWVMQTVTFK